MVDCLTPEKRSWNMSRIRGRNTTLELVVRSILHRMGYRFKVADRELPGRPDIVLKKHKTVVFVHGCFWHRHLGCPDTTTPKTRTLFWQEKFNSNVLRDRRNRRALNKLGWKVLVVWECQIKKNPLAVAARLLRALPKTTADRKKNHEIPSRKDLFRVAEARADYKLIEKTPNREKGLNRPCDKKLSNKISLKSKS